MKVDFLFVCSEGWEKMLPNEKGAHCNVCKKDVIDFSDMKKSEMIEMLKGEKGEGESESVLLRKAAADEKREGVLCGRFRPSQILELNFTDFFKKFSLWNLRRRIAVVFFFVMGAMMFSCTG